MLVDKNPTEESVILTESKSVNLYINYLRVRNVNVYVKHKCS